MAQVRIAVIGAGLIGRTHIAVLRAGNPDYALAGVADPSPAAAAEGRDARLSGLRHDRASCSSAPSPTARSWRCRTRCTSKVGLACIARKIPIIVEKPVADSVAEALELIEARRTRQCGDPHRPSPPPQPDHAQGGAK